MRAEGDNRFPHPADYTAFDIVRGTNNLLGCKHTLLPLTDFPINQHSQVLLLRAALNAVFIQAPFVLGISLTHIQGLALGLVKLNKVCTGLTLKTVKVLLNGIPSLSMLTTPPVLVLLANLLSVHLVHVTSRDVN